MKKHLVRVILVCTLMTVLLIGTVSAIAPEKPPVIMKPTIGTPSYTSDSATQVTIRVSVGWHYNPYYYRVVKVYVSGKGWYTMSPVGSLYQKTITGLNPSQAYSYKIQASEAWWEGEPPELMVAISTTSYRTIASCNPTLSLQICDVGETDVIMEYAVTSWGREGRGSYPQVKFMFRHSENTLPPDFWDANQYDTSYFEGYVHQDALVMDTTYNYKVRASHQVDGYVCEAVVEGSFHTDDWTPNRRYAIVVLADADTSNNAYVSHLGEYNAWLGFCNSRFTYVHHHQMGSVGDVVTLKNEFLDQFTWSHISSQHSSWPIPDSSSYVFIYIVGHGADNKIYTGKYSSAYYASGSELDSRIDTIPYGKMAIVIETCASGTLIDDIANSNRVIITAAYDETASCNDSGQRCYFSQYLLEKLAAGEDFYDAYHYAVTEYLLVRSDKHPMLRDYTASGSQVDMVRLVIYNDGPLAHKLSMYT